jgi:hypothetical protein
VAALCLTHTLRAENIILRVQETVVLNVAGATAAYTTNPEVADVSTAGSALSIRGHSAGTTQLMVITASGTAAYLVTVAATHIAPPQRQASGIPVVHYEGRYSSAVAKAQNSIDIVTIDGQQRTEFHILHLHHLRPAPGQLADGVASIFYRHDTPALRWTLLDETVDVSRMTLSNISVRGIHLSRDSLELHAGYASPSMYDDFFLPVERRWVAGAGYRFDTGSVALTPSLYGFFTGGEGSGGRRGAVAALTAEYRNGESLFLRGDVGAARSLAFAGELRHASARGHVRALISYKPYDFPTLGLADARGGHAEVDASHRATNRLSLTGRGTYDRFELTSGTQSIAGGGGSVTYAVTRRVSLVAGVDVSSVRTPGTSIRTIGVPLSAVYEGRGLGLAASYRLLDHSAAARRGDALHLSAHAETGRFGANVWADRQRNAPTLDLIFRAQPGLELALLRLGITVRNPEDVARALRDNAALIDLGVINGLTVDLTPQRLQGGVSLGWLGTGPRSNHVRLLAIYSRDEGISTTRDSMIATLTFSRRILSATDLYAAYSLWSTTVGVVQDSGATVDIGVRQQFNGLPAFLRRGGTIRGVAFLDPERRGVRGERTEPLAGIRITLDGVRTVQTDQRGAYAFDHVSPGLHRIAAELPDSVRTYFTTASRAETKVPAMIDFGFVRAAGRVDGTVLSDAGTPVGGVVLSAAAVGGVAISTRSDAEGRFVFIVPAGVFRIGLEASSLPAAYEMPGELDREVAVEIDRPARIAFELQARRSIAGRAVGASEVRIESLGRTAPVDASGNFLFRAMPAGTFTLTATIRGRIVSRTVTLPPQPAMLDDVLLEAPADAPASVGFSSVRHPRSQVTPPS